MAAAAGDLLAKVGSPGTATTLDSPGYTAGASSINVVSTTNWPTDTGVIFAIDTAQVVDGEEVQVAGSYNEFEGTVTSATQISNVDWKAGNGDTNYSAGALTRVYIPVSSERENRIVTWGTTEHAQDGTHTDITSTSVNTGTLTVTSGTTLPAGDIVTADLADDAVTPDKMDFGAQTATTTTAGTTTSTSYTATLTSGGTNPSVTAVVPASGKVFVSIAANLSNDTAGARSYVSVALSSGNTVAASDDNAIQFRGNAGAGGQVAEFGSTFMLTGLTAGSTVFTLNYKVSAGTGTFGNRKLTVIPIGD